MIELIKGRLNFLKKLLKLLEEKVHTDEKLKCFQEGVQDQIKEEICFLESLLEKGKEEEQK